MVASAACGCHYCKERFPTPERSAETEHSGSWQARYIGLDGREHGKNKPTEAEALALLEEMRTEVRKRTWLDPARGDITLCDWHALWWPAQVGEDATLDRDERMWRRHVLPAFGSQRLYELGYMEIQGWVNRLHDKNGGPLAAGSVIKAFQVLDRMLTAAKLDRRIPFNPAEGVKLPRADKVHPEDRRPPTYAQLWRIRACVPDYHHAFVIVAQETGLRFGELAGLRWCWVDLKGRRIQVREVLTEVRGTIRRKAYPKSDAGLRTVPITGLAARVLTEVLAAEPDASHARTTPKDGLHPEELVFHGRNRRGRDGQPARAPMRRSAWRRIWTRAITDAGVVRKTVKEWAEVETDKAGRKVKVEKSRTFWWPEFHDIRHAYASRLHARGVPEAITQELLGHERAGEVTWLYTHAAADYAGQALAALQDGMPGRRQARLRLVA
jgi:integrase